MSGLLLQRISRMEARIAELERKFSEPIVSGHSLTVNMPLTLAEQYAKKFGKPPHHLMKEETIRAKLNGG